MTAIREEIIQRIRNQYIQQPCTIDGTFEEDRSGTVTVTFDGFDPIIMNYFYTGRTVSEFMITVSRAVAAAINTHNHSLIDRTDFAELVATDGNINTDLVDYCIYSFGNVFSLPTAIYDGMNGLLSLQFFDKLIHVNFSYVGTSANMFRERLLEACALAVKSRNNVPQQSFYQVVVDEEPITISEITLTLPANKTGWNSIDVESLPDDLPQQ